MAWLLSIVMACSMHHAPTVPMEAVERYSVAIEAGFGPVVAADDELQPAMDAQLEMVVSLRPTRRFRDGSMGRLLVVEQAKLKVNGEPSPLELVGRSAEVRTFPNGEILDIGWGEKLSGPNRYMDVFEVLLPALSPAPPSVDVGAEARRRILWPFRSGRSLRWDNAVQAVWGNAGLVEVEGHSPQWDLNYEGPWALEGNTRFVDPEIGFRARGDAKGTVRVEHPSGRLISHRFEWSRTAQVLGENGVEQEQSFRGQLEAIR